MNVEHDSFVSEGDARALVRLLGEVAEIPGDHTMKKRHLMDGLCELIQADIWGWTLACEQEIGKPPVCLEFMHGGLGKRQFPAFLTTTGNSVAEPISSLLIEKIQERQLQITRSIGRTSGQVSQDGLGATHLWHECEVGTLLFSSRLLDRRLASCIGVCRNPGRSPFSARESWIARVVLSEVSWLHDQGWPKDRDSRGPSLSPRQRLVLLHLLESHSRKEIAGHLGISLNTVAGYVREVFQHFRVHSQTELLRRFMQGEGRGR